MRRFLFCFFLVISATSLLTASDGPNFVVFLVDDLGYGDLGCYGNRQTPTPNIDQLANEGIRFTDFHSNGPMCTPTRAALLTGMYQQRFGAMFEGPLSGDTQYDKGLPLTAFTIAEALKDAGYVTGMFGKWHLGYQPPFLPTHQGFDEFRGLVSGDGDHVSHVDRSGRPDWWQNDKLQHEVGYTAELLTNHSIDFLERHKDKRFLLYIPHLAIHFPWQTPADEGYRVHGGNYHNLTKLGDLPSRNVGEKVRQMITSVDDSLGRIMSAIRKLGLDKKTLVFFLSDNGGYLNYSGGFHNISTNGVLRGQKVDVYEGGHRVPAIAWWPGRIQPGVSNETIMTFDLFPTFCELAAPNAKSTTSALDGQSIANVLFKNATLPQRTLFWKMGREKAVRRGPWKLVVNQSGQSELFNLERDISERKDVSDANRTIVNELESELASWEAEMSSTSGEFGFKHCSASEALQELQ